MKLLLRETVDQLGTIGDVVQVPDGYGRNFLLPRGIAVAVTPENIRRLEAKKSELLAAEAKRRDEAVALADRVKSKSVTIHAKASGEEGKLYGSVTTQAIAEQFQKDGLPIKAQMILLDQPIKELGVFDVRLRLFPQVEVEAKVWVIEEGQPEGTLPPNVVAANKAREEAEAKKAAKAEKAAKGEKPAAAEGAEGGEAAAAEGEAKPKKEKKPRKEKAEGADEAAEAAPAAAEGGKGKKEKAKK